MAYANEGREGATPNPNPGLGDDVDWRDLIERMHEGFVVCEVVREGADGGGEPVDFRYTYLNAAFQSLTGLDPDDVTGRPAAEAVPGLEPEWTVDLVRVGITQRPTTFTRFVAVLGRWYDIHAFPLGDERFGVLFLDATERERAEALLEERTAALERRLTATVSDQARTWQVTPDLLSVIGADGAFVQVNPAWETALGYPIDAIVGRRFAEFLHPDDVTRTLDTFEHMMRTNEPALRFENRYRHADGGWRWLSWVAVPEDGRVFCCTRDVSADKAREAELAAAGQALRQSQKLDMIGQLTGGIAHDFNNLLMAMQSSLELLDGTLAPDNCLGRSLVGDALAGVARGAALTQRLLAFARKQDLAPGAVDVGRLIAGMGDLLVHSVGPHVRIACTVAEGTPAASVDGNQLEMALLNLAVNARDAMSGHGELGFAVAPRRRDDAGTLPPGDYVRVTVTDTGVGMDAGTLEKAAEPFFTTKAVGTGTGLGLSMIHGLTVQSGGSFRLTSEPGVGTTAEILLPASSGPATVPDTNEVPGASASGVSMPVRSRRILVVDDDALVLRGMAGILVKLGHEVYRAESGVIALQTLAREAPMEVVITDQLMPGMTGLELASSVRRTHPGTAVILATGYTDVADIEAGLIDARLVKPFDRARLESVLGSV